MIFINCFEVPAGAEAAFLERYRVVNRYVRGHPGWVSNRLHQESSGQARFRFVNVSEWESAQAYDAAHDAGFAELVVAFGDLGVRTTNGQYEVVDEHYA